MPKCQSLVRLMFALDDAMTFQIKPSHDLWTLVQSVSLSFAVLIGTQAIAEVDSQVINLSELQWGPPGGGNGFPVGVRTTRVDQDAVSGGITYYAMFPAGSHFSLHWHTYDEYVVVVSGKVNIQLDSQSHELQTGSYVVIPGKVNHAWTVPAKGEDAVILVRRTGPADFHFIE